ncbi:NB-ARC domain-containing protein [Nocardioidaceae bacterium SCSIO 66511]|nr:NB-ARC domain-containing protein [Nocardioidaceae bacterium SCSIO 66511]
MPLTIPAPKQKRLLAVLLASGTEWVTTDRLIDVLWSGEPPRSARSNLHVYVYRLRGVLGEDRIEHRDGGYRLAVDPEETDAGRFELLAASGSYHEALALWRGEPYVGVTDMEVVREEAARLDELRLNTLEARIDDDLRHGLHTELVAELTNIVTQHPLRERFSGQLMLALYRAGRASHALEVYSSLRTQLVEELGTEPGKPLRELQQAILAEDPELEGTPKPNAPTHTVPAELPPAIGSFSGRNNELERVGAMLTDAREPSVPVVAIAGPGGIGKSALAVQAAHTVADAFPDGQLYVNLQGATPGMRPLQSREVLERLLRSLGDADFDAPRDVDEASARLRTLTADRKILVVLDDVVDSAQVRPLLPGGKGCGVLVTSRSVLASLDGAVTHQLDALDDAEATDLLGRVMGVDRLHAEPEAAQELAALCDRLPLALCIAGAKLNRRPNWPIAELVRRLADEQRRLDELELPDRAVRASFTVSITDVGPDAARMFRLLGLLAGPDFGVPVAAALAEVADVEAERLLDELVDAQLADSRTPGRFRLHDLLRLFARDQAYAVESESDREGAVRRTLHCYLATARTAELIQTPDTWRDRFLPDELAHEGQRLQNEAEIGAWLSAELPNLLASARQGSTLPTDGNRLAAAFAVMLFTPMNTRGRWYELRELIELGLEALGDNPLTDHHALLLNDLGWINALVGDPGQAPAHLDRALAHWRATGNRRGEATTLRVLARSFGERGRAEDAIDHARAALALFNELGVQHGQVDCLITIGLQAARLERFDEAITAHIDGIKIAEDIGDRWLQGVLHGNVADLYRRSGDRHLAITEFEKALHLDHTSGNAETYFEAEHLWGLGRALHEVGDTDSARRCWDRSARILRGLRLIGTDELTALLTTPHPETPEVIARQI